MQMVLRTVPGQIRLLFISVREDGRVVPSRFSRGTSGIVHAVLPKIMSSCKPYSPAIGEGVYYGKDIRGPLCIL